MYKHGRLNDFFLSRMSSAMMSNNVNIFWKQNAIESTNNIK